MDDVTDFLDRCSGYSWRWVVEQLLIQGLVTEQQIIEIVEPEEPKEGR
jgi:hypothetical protein